MNINIQYNVSKFDSDVFVKFMSTVSEYAKRGKNIDVWITDSLFVCEEPGILFEPKKCEEIKKIISDLNNDLEESEHTAEEDTQETCEEKNGADEEHVTVVTGKCKNCDCDFQLKKKSNKFCSNECRKEYFHHGSKSRAERAAAKKNIEELVCPICGDKFQKKYHKQKCCSDDCQKIYTDWNRANKKRPVSIQEFVETRDVKKAEKKRIAELKQRQCANPECKKMFTPTTEDQKYCSKECKAAAHEQRKASKLVDVPPVPTGRYKHICEVCEQPFSDDELVSKFCPKCIGTFGIKECIGLAEDTKARKLVQTVVRPGQRQYKVCPKCGHNFDTIDPNQFFCDDCTARALRQPKVKPLKPLKPEPLPPED